jgi:carboxypeptidase D
VKRAINAPVDVHWEECSINPVYNTSSGNSVDADANLYSGLTVLPGVIDRSARTIIAHGSLDMVLMSAGTLLTIQNMTFGGRQGFDAAPSGAFYVPYHNSYQDTTLAAAGVMGVTHTERKLTYCSVSLSGHMVPQYQPSAAYRQMEFLLGRVPSLESTAPFTVSSDGLVGQPDAPQ